MSDFIPVNTPLLAGNEKKYLNECIDTGWISSEGPFVKQFEEQFADRMGRQYGVTVANGTVALTLAVRTLGLSPGDEVIMPSFTIISCIQAILENKLKPVLIDSTPDTWNMDVAAIEAKVTHKTKAIMVVHTYGLPVDMDKVLQLAKKHQLKIIEDAAEAHGLTYRHQPCGSFGDISTFSFYPNKLVTTGEGGMIVTDDKALYEQCCYLRNLAFENPRFVHQTLGYNYRMSNIQAAVGLAQLEKLDEFLEKKYEMGAFYQEQFKGLPNLICPVAKTDYANNVYWVFGLLAKSKEAHFWMQALKEEGVGSRPFFYPMHWQPVFQKRGYFANEQYPNAEHISKMGFYIPSGLGLSHQQMQTVADTVVKIAESKALNKYTEETV